MSMTVVVTRNVSERVRGFLSSTMLEVAPGVYSSSRISPAVRDRIWEVLDAWFLDIRDGSIVMIWQEREMVGGQAIKILGSPPVSLIKVDGLILARR